MNINDNAEFEYSFQGSSGSSETVDITNVASHNVDDLRLCRGTVGAYLDRNHVIWYSSVYAIPIISLVGIVSNLINAWVLWKIGKRLPSHTYLLALSICDCLFLTFATLEVTPIMLDNLVANPTFNKIYTHSVLYLRFVSATCFKVSVMLVVGFNIERYICVCQPMRSGSLCNKRNARRAVCLFVFVSITLSVHWPLIHGKDTCFDTATNSTFYMIRLPDSHVLQIYNQIMNYVSMIFFNIAPIFAMFALNVSLLLTLRRVIDRESPDVRRRSRSTNAILFSVVALFLVCNGPQVPARILFEKYGPYDHVVSVYVAVSQQLIFMNASLNFCLYCLVSRKYRKLLKQTFPWCSMFASARLETILSRLNRCKTEWARKTIAPRPDILLTRSPGAVLELKLDDTSSQGCQPILQCCEMESG